MIQEANIHGVQVFDSIGNEHVNTTPPTVNNGVNSSRTTSLKTLATGVLQRNKQMNITRTEAKNSVHLREHEMNTNERRLNTANDYEERAAIIEHEAGIPRQWAEAFARVDTMTRPASIPPAHWQRIIDATGRMLDNSQHIRDMAHYGWDVADIFGCHAGAPVNRTEVKGLLLMLREGEMIRVVDDKAIEIRTAGGGSTCYYRPWNTKTEGIMLWELK